MMSNSISKTTSSPESVTPVAAVHRTPLGSLNLQSTRRNSNNRVNTDEMFKLQKENFLIERDLINKIAAIQKVSLLAQHSIHSTGRQVLLICVISYNPRLYKHETRFTVTCIEYRPKKRMMC